MNKEFGAEHRSFVIDRQNGVLSSSDGEDTMPLYSPEAFRILSDLWVTVGWSLKYTYSFTWFGRPVIQLPEDLLRIQEVIYRVKPDVVVETGVAHGGSLVFYATLFEAMGRGRVIGVDVEIRAHNRRALESHELFPLITLLEGDSVAPDTVREVESLIEPNETVLVVLDSNHTRIHVAAEIEAYSRLVSVGSYIVVTDGIMEYLHDVPGGKPEWRHDNPKAAAGDFVRRNQGFILDDPPAFPFNEGEVTNPVTHWPGAYLRRIA